MVRPGRARPLPGPAPISLFRRELVVCSLSSGSAGNCTYIGDGHRGVLVDAGISPRQVEIRMEDLGLKNAPIHAVLITHEHQDHIGAAAVLSRQLAKKRKAVPFFMTRGTYAGAKLQCRPEGVEFIEAGASFFSNDIGLDAVPVPHDTEDPIAWRVRLGSSCTAVITDLGRPTRLVANAMLDCDVMVLEFNHDEQMLLDGPYPLHLKQRIRGNHGHLSNAQAAELLGDGASPRLRHLLLAHLSEENNRPDLARDTASAVLQGGGWNAAVHVTRQRAAIPPVRLEINPFG